MQENRETKQGRALHDLICAMLRGPHIRRVAGADLAIFVNRAGIALHNIPLSFANNEPIRESQLKAINEIDPDGGNETWGPWVTMFCSTIGQPLPSSL